MLAYVIILSLLVITYSSYMGEYTCSSMDADKQALKNACKLKTTARPSSFTNTTTCFGNDDIKRAIDTNFDTYRFILIIQPVFQTDFLECVLFLCDDVLDQYNFGSYLERDDVTVCPVTRYNISTAQSPALSTTTTTPTTTSTAMTITTSSPTASPSPTLSPTPSPTPCDGEYE